MGVADTAGVNAAEVSRRQNMGVLTMADGSGVVDKAISLYAAPGNPLAHPIGRVHSLPWRGYCRGVSRIE